MSAPVARNESRRFAQEVIPLLKEYAKKLNLLRKQAQEIRENFVKERVADNQQMLRDEYSRLTQFYHRLGEPATNLAQAVSQKIEHGSLDELTRVELRLRLAEFESALQSANTIHSWFPPG